MLKLQVDEVDRIVQRRRDRALRPVVISLNAQARAVIEDLLPAGAQVDARGIDGPELEIRAGNGNRTGLGLAEAATIRIALHHQLPACPFPVGTKSDPAPVPAVVDRAAVEIGRASCRR